MRILKIVLIILLVVLIVVVVGGFLVYRDTTQAPLPQETGSLTLPGLEAEVEILRDEYGIPHVYAQSMHDLYFAQGVVQAQDRWWQMEFARHIGQGSIQELTGQNDSVAGTDRFIRMADWYGAAQREWDASEGETRDALQAFSDGVNAYINTRSPSQLALEYRLLGLTGVDIPIEPWTPVDSLAWGKVMAWDLSGSTDVEYTSQAVLDALGADMLADFMPPWPYGNSPTILDEADLPITDASLQPQGSAKIAFGTEPRQDTDALGTSPTADLRTGSGIGSNNWVSTGTMTETGQPLLANDPHLGIQMPAIWYEIGLHCAPVTDACPMDMRGFALPAAPGVIIGHNDRIAWGVTNVGADVLDLYRLTINPDNPLQYRWNGEWRDMTTREEVIRFGDGGSQTITVRDTHLGPIISDNYVDTDGNFVGFNPDEALAMRWTGSDTGSLFDAVFRLNKAQDWGDFRDALSHWNVPAQNVIYADVDGNIGYQTPGSMPIRPQGQDGTLPVDADGDEDVWLGYLPYDSLPRILNPERDYIVTANQAVVPLDYYDELAGQIPDGANAELGQYWAYGQRGGRINDLLNQLAPLSIADYQTIHGDNYNVNASVIVPFLADIDMGSDSLNGLRDWLVAWDYQNNADSPQAALFAAFSAHLVDDVFNDQLPEGYRATGMQLYSVGLLLDKPDNAWWDDSSTADVTETRDAIVAAAFAQGVEQMRAAQGDDQTAWNWGDLHGATFVSNPLGQSGIGPIEDIVNRGPQPVGGGIDIVNATGYNIGSALDGDYSVQALPSMRQIIDLSDFDNSLSIITTGQSGHPFSPHYADQIEQWAAIQYHPMLYSRSAVEASTQSRLVLSPG